MSARAGHAPTTGAHDSGPRRRLRRAAIVAAVTALVGVGGAVAAADAQEHDFLPEDDWSEEQIAAAEDLVMRTEEALAAYADATPAELEALGFTNFRATAPGGYDHWTNQDFLVDEHILDPEFPESLVFQQTGDSSELVAVMFEMNFGDTMDDIPDDIIWYPGWHSHPDLCADENGQFTGFVDENGECAVGSPILIPMMHVWIVDNECGHRFAGIDQGGLICDVEGHPDGHGTTTSTTHQHDTTTTTHAHSTTSTNPTTTTTPSTNPNQPAPGNPDFMG